MLSLTDRDAVAAALQDPDLDPCLRALIGLRVWQVDTNRQVPLGEVLQIVVIGPGDSAEEVHPVVGFPILWEQADQPGFEWFHDHGAWFEVCYIVTDDFGMLIFVADDPGVDAGLRFNLLGIADREPSEATA